VGLRGIEKQNFEERGINMKTLITAFGLAAALLLSVASTSVFAASLQGWADCNSQYSACLRDGTNMSVAGTPSDAVAQGSDNTSNWASCNSALAACYQSGN
jgi:hypothetical protein